ncbi:S-layer homology domain protein [Neomoorella glycerini]|uniref:S-layer homology domain protein n=1 Tax=Neomoorella glycerini TaxID=55779 RepID=A0A6I5ZML8_9FIRM|nr:YcdB/YcdC domain-containing protein [Moorella glycerini]QGP91110.1 S-layer homology domain protein [Moorella glycerini]
MVAKIWQRFLAWGLVVLLLVSLFAGLAVAEDKPVVTLEQAIRTVKDNFEISKEYSRFTSSFNSYDGRQTWSLHWNEPAEPGGSFNADVDASTGEIINMNTWKPEKRPEPGLRLPAISAAEARKVAEKLLNQLAARYLPELQLLPDNNRLLPINNYGPVTYTFRWQRVVNGIPFPGNDVTITVRGDDGQVTNYNLNWTKADFPAATGAISPERARQVFAGTGMLELQYYLQPPYRPLAAGEKRPVLLVYRLSHPSRGLIDALSGAPLDLGNGGWFDKGGAGGMGYAGEMARKAAFSQGDVQPKPLSPEEMKEIEKTAKLISREEAIAAIKKWVDIPAGLTLRGANLYADWQDPEIRSWNLNWSSDKPEPGKPGYMSARVNASNGELLGFDLSSAPSGSDRGGKLDRKAAQRLAEDFLQKVQPQRFKEVQLDENYRPGWEPVIMEDGQNPAVQYFYYRRLVNGIPFPGNGINVTVDAVAGRITSYNLNWGNFAFPVATNILDGQQAVEAFLKKRPLTMSYTQIYSPGGPGQGELRLVYQPLGDPGYTTSDMLDARTGQFLDWEGKPVAQQPRPYRFNDIAGNFAEKEINLLGQAGIFGEYGEAFHPDENVTVVSLLRAMLMARNGVWGYKDLKDEEILKRAREEKWLQEDLQAGATVSRETLAKFMIRFLNLERAALAEGIYKVPYSDAGSLSPGSLGYVALTWGLGILKGNGFTFEPNHIVTRAEAAAALIRALEVKP